MIECNALVAIVLHPYVRVAVMWNNIFHGGSFVSAILPTTITI
uniref:Uncharacterized protein n=1 Tax=Ascaris lumbricoides TaxID=6252 RepID=A0A0M3IHZ9_ASCLU